MKITVKEAQQFIDIQQNVGDYTALEKLEEATLKSSSYEFFYPFIKTLQSLNDLIVGMELGSFPFIKEVDAMYREGIGYLLSECEKIIENNKENK